MKHFIGGREPEIVASFWKEGHQPQKIENQFWMWRTVGSKFQIMS